jgi:hypothetical protein
MYTAEHQVDSFLKAERLKETPFSKFYQGSPSIIWSKTQIKSKEKEKPQSASQ